MGLPYLVLRHHPIGFRSQAIPEAFICFDGLAGIEALQKKFFQFLSRSLETAGCLLDSGKSCVDDILRRRLEAGIHE